MRIFSILFSGILVLNLWHSDVQAQRDVWEQHMRAAAAAHQQGNFTEALKEGRAGLNAAETVGLDGPPMAQLVTYLAVLHGFNGQRDQAELLYKRGLEIRQRTLGFKHPDVAESFHRLGQFYWNRGRFVEALQPFKQALEIRETTLGLQHNETRQTRRLLSTTYRQLDRHTDADALLQNVIQRKSAKPSSPAEDTQKIEWDRNFRAGTINHTRRNTCEAEQQIELALEIAKQFGPDDSRLRRAQYRLAQIYQDQHKYDDAEPLLKNSLELNKQVFGPENQFLSTYISPLAANYQAQENYTEAERLFKRALEVEKNSPRLSRLSIAKAMGNLANLYVVMDRHRDAEPLFEEALMNMERAVGPDHPIFAVSINNSALFYLQQQQYSQAENLFQRAMKILESSLGPEHLSFAASLENYAVLLRKTGRLNEAKKVSTRVGVIRANHAKNNPGNCGLAKGQPHFVKLNTLSK